MEERTGCSQHQRSRVSPRVSGRNRTQRFRSECEASIICCTAEVLANVALRGANHDLQYAARRHRVTEHWASDIRKLGVADEHTEAARVSPSS